MRISDWSSDVCSSDLIPPHYAHALSPPVLRPQLPEARSKQPSQSRRHFRASTPLQTALRDREPSIGRGQCPSLQLLSNKMRSEEHTSELQSLMRISYAVFCLKKKNKKTHIEQT